MEDTKDSKQLNGNQIKSEYKIDSNEKIKIENDRYLQTLQSHFHHDAFRPEQLEIIKTVIEEKRDVCAIMASGYGKSLCFQFPAVFQNGVTLVISPIIALMQDQVLKLEQLNIQACFLGKMQTDLIAFDRIRRNEVQIIYCSPESLVLSTDLLEILKVRLTLIAVDEAHVSWNFHYFFRYKIY